MGHALQSNSGPRPPGEPNSEEAHTHNVGVKIPAEPDTSESGTLRISALGMFRRS